MDITETDAVIILRALVTCDEAGDVSPLVPLEPRLLPRDGLVTAQAIISLVRRLRFKYPHIVDWYAPFLDAAAKAKDG